MEKYRSLQAKVLLFTFLSLFLSSQPMAKAADVQASFTGLVFNDMNGNGTQDAGEMGMDGVAVELKQGANSIATTTTAGGVYSFNTVLVEETLNSDVIITTPAGFTLTAGTSTQSFDPSNYNGNLIQAVTNGYQSNTILPPPPLCVGTVTGKVFYDSDISKSLSFNSIPQDLSLAGVNVNITDSNGVVTPLVTDSNGDYSKDLNPGTYTVAISGTQDPNVIKANYQVNTSNSTQANLNVDTTCVVTQPSPIGFHDQTLGGVSGRIYIDANQNKGFDNGENAVGAGVVVNLTGAGNTLTTTTAGNGYYQFSDVKAGQITVTVDKANTPANVLPATAVVTTNNEIQNFTLTGGTVKDVDFVGYFYDQTATSDLMGTLSGSVFFDGNNNGTVENGESGIGPNVFVNVTGLNGFAQTVQTLSNGYFAVKNVPAGAVKVTVDKAATSTTLIPAASTLTTGGNGGTDVDQVVNVPANGVGVAKDIGYFYATAGLTGNVRGLLFYDQNGNGKVDNDPANPLVGKENGIGAGAVVEITAPGFSQTTTTLTNGVYIMNNVPAGAVKVTVLESASPAGLFPAGWTITTAGNMPSGAETQNIFVPAGSTALTASVGYKYTPTGSGSFSGAVFFDTDNNATPNTGDTQLTGSTVQIQKLDGTVITTAFVNPNVANDVYYTASGIPAGLVKVVVTPTLPPFAQLSTAPFGVQTQIVSIPSGSTGSFNPVGFSIPTASLKGFVFNDFNNNGVQNGADNGAANLDVTLTIGNNPAVTVKTDANGFYTFSNLIVGSTATVKVTPPTGFDVTSGTGIPLVINNPQDIVVGSPTQATPVGIGHGWNFNVVKTDGVTEVNPGTHVTYTITILSNLPVDANGVLLNDMMPANLLNASWTCFVENVACGTGTGDIKDLSLNVPAGKNIIITVTGDVTTVNPGTQLINTATITMPVTSGNGGSFAQQIFTDSTLTDNSSTDTDAIVATPIIPGNPTPNPLPIPPVNDGSGSTGGGGGGGGCASCGTTSTTPSPSPSNPTPPPYVGGGGYGDTQQNTGNAGSGTSGSSTQDPSTPYVGGGASQANEQTGTLPETSAGNLMLNVVLGLMIMAGLGLTSLKRKNADVSNK